MSPTGQNPPSDEPAPKRPKRTLKLTASQRERKRAIDREAQRSIRLKTKNYIAHLENLVRIMENGGSTANGAAGTPQSHGQTREQDDERARALLSQLRQSEEEVQKLKEMVFGVQKLVGTAGNSGEDPNARWLAYPNGGGAEQSLQTPSSLHDRALDHLDNCASVYSHSSGSSSPMGELGYQSIDQSRSADAYGSGYAPPPSLQQDPYNSFGRLPPRSDAPTSDPNDSSKMKEEGELFFLSDREVNRVLAGGHQSFTNQPLDEDIVVRAVLHGWREVQDQYLLDQGWQALRNIDQTIFRESGIVERMAILYMMRLKLLHQSNANPQFLAPLPPFFQRSTLEDPEILKKMPVIEHFIWPGMRTWLCKNAKKSVSNKFCDSFRQSFKFIWPYEVSDAFTRDPSTQLYSITAGFKQRQWDLRSWTMRRDFFAVASDLINAIPVYDPPTIDRSMVAGSFSAASEPNTGQMCQKMHPQRVVPKMEEQEVDQSQLGMVPGNGHAHAAGPGPPSVSAHTPTSVPSHIPGTNAPSGGNVPQAHMPYSAEVEAWLGDPELVPPYWNLAPGMHVGYEATSQQWTRVQGGFIG